MSDRAWMTWLILATVGSLLLGAACPLEIAMQRIRQPCQPMSPDKSSARHTITAWVLGGLMLVAATAGGLYQLARHDAAMCCRRFVGFAVIGEEVTFYNIEFRTLTPVVKFTDGSGTFFVEWRLVPFRETHLGPIPR